MIIKDIQKKGMSSSYTEASFDKGKEELEKEGYQIISFEQNARLRMQEGKDSYVSQNGNWVREGFLYIPHKGKFLTKTSPIMIYPIEDIRANKDGKGFYLTNEQAEVALRDSLKLSNKDFSIPTNRFGEDKIINYIFGNSAQEYGNFLKDAGITEMPVGGIVNNLENKPSVRQAWFIGLGSESKLLIGGDFGCLLYGDCPERVRGIRKEYFIL